VVPTARDSFHVYAVEWTPSSIRGYVDDSRYFWFANERLTDAAATYMEWPFDQPFHLILNIAVGGGWGGAEGVDPNIWPQRLEVDYVRVYQRDE
jgi:beta-glucanase (GH16 family)